MIILLILIKIVWLSSLFFRINFGLFTLIYNELWMLNISLLSDFKDGLLNIYFYNYSPFNIGIGVNIACLYFFYIKSFIIFQFLKSDCIPFCRSKHLQFKSNCSSIGVLIAQIRLYKNCFLQRCSNIAIWCFAATIAMDCPQDW